MRRGSRKTDRLPPQLYPYTPTPDGFERRLRAWVRLPTDDVPIPGAGDASASPEAQGAREQTRPIAPRRKCHRRRRGEGQTPEQGNGARP
jgi:hypothetical protein